MTTTEELESARQRYRTAAQAVTDADVAVTTALDEAREAGLALGDLEAAYSREQAEQQTGNEG